MSSTRVHMHVLHFALLISASLVPVVLANVPVQTYYLPLSEDHLLNSFQIVNAEAASPVTSLTSISVAAAGTIIWVDHWEDGYEPNMLAPVSTDTEIWGDGNAANGCAPDVVTCTNATDILQPGTAIVIQNDVPVPRLTTTRDADGNFLYDGSDKIASNFPIAITRGGYPSGPGSLMAGAVEVQSTDYGFGTSFRLPIATNMGTTLDPHVSFEATDVLLMANEDGTIVTVPDGLDAVGRPDGVTTDTGTDIATTYTLDAGQSLRLEGFHMIDRSFTTSKPVQAAAITGDKGSRYEMRWYSLLPVSLWAEEYWTPVGDADTRVILTTSEDQATAMTIKWEDVNGINAGSITIPAGGGIASFTLSNGSGYRFFSQTSGDKFFGITQTDNSGGGSTSDWGHPLLPGTLMTSKVLIGLAYACTNNDCGTEMQYSPLWVTAAADGTIHIDYDSDGIVDTTTSINAMQSLQLTDPDQDFSGATLYATDTSGDPNTIAVAWGQVTDIGSGGSQSKMLDMGTIVLPLPILEALKTCTVEVDADGNGVLSPGDTLECVIRVTNTGNANIDDLTICETLDGESTYQSNTMTYDPGNGTEIPIADDTAGDPFQLDGCHNLTDVTIGPNSAVEITYQIKIDPCHEIPESYDAVTASGTVSGSLGTSADFESRDALTSSISVCCPAQTGEFGTELINLGGLTRYLFFFEDGTSKAKIAGTSKGFVGDTFSNVPSAKEETSGTVPYAGAIATVHPSLTDFQIIIDNNVGQASGTDGQTTMATQLTSDFDAAVAQIDSLAVDPAYHITTSDPSTDVNNLNTQNGISETYIIDVTGGDITIQDPISITGDASDIFVWRWNKANGYDNEVDFKDGNTIIPQGGLSPGNFFHLAGYLKSSGGGNPPPAPYPQGPYINNALITNGAAYSNENYFTGYWLTIDPSGSQAKISNAVWVGGWYTNTTHIEIDKGGGYYTCPNFMAIITDAPTTVPSVAPSGSPSLVPSAASEMPSSKPSTEPTTKPSGSPSSVPSAGSETPSLVPSIEPTVQPSSRPSRMPSVLPSFQPSSEPSVTATEAPSASPSIPLPNATDCNTFCKAMNFTSHEDALDIRSWTVPLCTTECVELELYITDPEGVEWLACIAYVNGIDYTINGTKTYIPSTACTMYTMMPGETIGVRVMSRPSHKCEPQYEVMHPGLNSHYTSNHAECAETGGNP